MEKPGRLLKKSVYMKLQAYQSRRFELCIVSIFFTFLLGGCATDLIVQPNGTLVRHYFGYVRVEVPQAEASKPVYASDVLTLGVRVGDGVSVGFLRDKQIMVPLDCRLVVLVSNQLQLDDAVSKLSFFKSKPEFCVAVNPVLQSGDVP